MAELTLWEVIPWVAGALGLGLVAKYVVGVPGPREIADRVHDWMDARRGKGTHFTILIAILDHDDDKRSQTNHVFAALEPYQGLHVWRIGRVLRLPQQGDRDENRLKAESLGQTWLKERNGDVLVWGEVAEANKRLRLRFLPRQEGLEGRGGSYRLDDAELPKDFGDDFDAVLVALVLTAIAPATERQGECLAEDLEPVAQKLQPLCAHMPAGLDDDQRGSLWYALGLVTDTIGEQKGDNAWLEEAIRAYREALKEYTRERAPLQWAGIQNNLGAVLRTLGERESRTARLEKAVAAFHEALKEQTRERVPLDWATTWNNLGNALSTLGNALFTLGERESGTARLEKAVAAFHEALKERTRERVPLDWAMTWNNLGNALAILGEQESGTARLEQAVTAYHEALKERTREHVPLAWARTQNNLGGALFRLGEREGGTVRLEEAVAAFRGALEVFQEAGAEYYIAGTEGNFARAEALLAERRGGTAAK